MFSLQLPRHWRRTWTKWNGRQSHSHSAAEKGPKAEMNAKKWFLCVSRWLSPLVATPDSDCIHCTNGLNIIIDLMWYHAPWLFPLSNLIILIYSTDFSWALPSNTVWVFALPAGVEDICVRFCFVLICFFCFFVLMESHTRELLDSVSPHTRFIIRWTLDAPSLSAARRLIVLPAHLCNDTVQSLCCGQHPVVYVVREPPVGWKETLQLGTGA